MQAAQVTAGQREAVQAMQHVKILLANKDASIRQCLRRIMESAPGLEVAWEAEDGLKALIKARKHHPDFILLEAHMPYLNGCETAHALRKEGICARIVVLVSLEEHKKSALDAGANAVILADSGCEVIRTTILNVLAQSEASTVTSDTSAA